MTECNCNRGDIPRIVRGNNFTLMVAVKHPVLTSDGNTELEDFDISTCTDIKVTLVTRLGRRKEMPFSIGDNADNTSKVILVDFDETVPSGLYGLEIVGKDSQGNDWRFYGAPGEVLQIVEPTSAAFIPSADTTEGYYDLTVNVGVLQYSQGILDDMKVTLDKNKTALSANEKATKECIEATTAAKDATENANKAVDMAKKILKETLTVSLSCNHDENIIGKKVYVKNSEDGSILEQHDWQGETIKTNIAPDQKYYVECEEMEGYSIPKSEKFTAVSGNVREVSIAYESEWFYPTLQMEDGTDCDGVLCTMYYRGESRTVTVTYKKGMCIKVPFHQYYQLVPATKESYYSGIFIARYAHEEEYHETASYKPAKTEIGIQMLDGTVITAENWDDTKYSKENVNGVVVCTSEAQFIIPPIRSQMTNVEIPYRLNSDGQKEYYIPDGVDAQEYVENAKGALGLKNTEALLKGFDFSSGSMVIVAYNTFLQSGKRCYLAAIDEVRIVSYNYTKINACFQKITGSDLNINRLVSSTMSLPHKYFWNKQMDFYYPNSGDNLYILAVAPL